MKQVRINIRSLANSASIRTEKRNGRDLIIVPSATLPDNVVMNGIMYPADEIAKGYMTLDRTPAPLGHPTVNGMFVSASDPEGINLGYVGAWNENVRQDGGRVLMDKVIDIEVANRTENGKRLLKAIENKKPIHTSTGLLAEMEDVENAEGYKRIARNMYFDHDAILLDEEGAAKPSQGVGMMVNSNGETLEVVNSTLEALEEEIDWAGMRLVDALERKGRVSAWERIKTAIMEAMLAPERTNDNTGKEEHMSAEMQKQIEDLGKQVTDLSTVVSGLDVAKVVGDAVANALKPILEATEKAQNAEKVKQDAEKLELVNKVVKANLLTEAIANTLAVEALRELATKTVPGKATGLVNAMGGTTDSDEFADMDLNKLMEAK